MSSARPVLTALVLALLSPTPAACQSVFNWAGPDTAWSTAANWVGGAVPVSGPNTAVEITTPQNTQSFTGQNLANPFVLNSLKFVRETPPVEAYYRVIGGDLEFRATTAGVLPALTHDAVAGREILNRAVLADTVTVGGIGGYPLKFSGQLAGPGGFVKAGDFEVVLTGDLAFAGPTSVLGGQLTYEGAARPSGDIVNNGVMRLSSSGINYAGTISGTGSVVVAANEGTVVSLTGSNTYAGGTDLTRGTLQVSSDAALGAAGRPVQLNGGVFRASGSFTTPRPFAVGSTGATIEVAGWGTTFVLSGPLSGSTSLTKRGAGILTLSGTANPYTGSLTVAEGVVRVAHPGAVQSFGSGRIFIPRAGVLAAGYTPDVELLDKVTFHSTGVIALTADTDVGILQPAQTFLGAAGGPVTYSGNLATAAADYRLGGGASSAETGATLTVASNLTQGGVAVGTGDPLSGRGTVVLTGTNTYPGGTTVNTYATLRVDSDARLGASGSTLRLGGGTFQAGAAFAASRPVVVDVPSVVDTAGFDVTLSGIVSGATGHTLTKAGAGTLTLTNSANAAASLAVAGGTLRFTTAPATAPIVSVAAAGRLDLAELTGAMTVAGLSGAGAVTTAGGVTLRHNRASGTDTFTGIISGAGSLEKAGAGILTVGGANTYTGGTTLAGGTLRLGATDTLPDAGAVRLAGGVLSTGAAGGFSDAAGPLELLASSSLVLAPGTHTLTFDGLSGVPAGTLNVFGWQGATYSPGSQGRILFSLPGEPNAAAANATHAAFLSSVQFNGFGVGDAILIAAGGSLYELTPVPEPRLALLLVAGWSALLWGRRHFGPATRTCVESRNGLPSSSKSSSA